MRKSIEFIDEYRMGDGDLDWQFHDNHGVLVRCRECKWSREDLTYKDYFYCDRPFMQKCVLHNSNWYCGDGKRKGDES